MDLCTGSFEICMLCSSPKNTPSTQMTRPASSRLWPVTPMNSTLDRSGITSSASLAKAGAEAINRAAAAARVLSFRIVSPMTARYFKKPAGFAGGSFVFR